MEVILLGIENTVDEGVRLMLVAPLATNEIGGKSWIRSNAFYVTPLQFHQMGLEICAWKALGKDDDKSDSAEVEAELREQLDAAVADEAEVDGGLIPSYIPVHLPYELMYPVSADDESAADDD